ncbi:hypothetical protein ACN38_g2742 [Penicillium nordicum]|uniref:Uncharacterized protein n=1 Tax=Penicillium nordicum TaxID=229535 RepID=A0A0M8P6U8_9EURO|nr:hypothetical protein ACN38_g2742 [Penicillium nordicum]
MNCSFQDCYYRTESITRSLSFFSVVPGSLDLSIILTSPGQLRHSRPFPFRFSAHILPLFDGLITGHYIINVCAIGLGGCCVIRRT